MGTKKLREDKDTHLLYEEFIQREETRYHHGYDEEMLQYRYIREGDFRSIEESKRLFRNNINGNLSDDPVRHFKYLFVASTTLACRAAIDGGVEAQVAYNMSDIYIRDMDKCKTVDDVFTKQTEMIRGFTQKVCDYKETPYNYQSYSPVIEKIIDYIYLHLHEKIEISELAEFVSLSPNYLNGLFRSQVGSSIGTYIQSKKVEVASNMLLHSKYSLTEIAAILGFCSSSHFICTFKRITGKTPIQFKRS